MHKDEPEVPRRNPRGKFKNASNLQTASQVSASFEENKAHFMYKFWLFIQKTVLLFHSLPLYLIHDEFYLVPEGLGRASRPQADGEKIGSG